MKNLSGDLTDIGQLYSYVNNDLFDKARQDILGHMVASFTSRVCWLIEDQIYADSHER